MCLNVACIGVERLDVVQVSHWKLAEMTGEAKRDTSSSESLYIRDVCMKFHRHSIFAKKNVTIPVIIVSLQPCW